MVTEGCQEESGRVEGIAEDTDILIQYIQIDEQPYSDGLLL
jgi:hypothetical protein